MKTSKQRGRWKYPKGFLVAETVSSFVMSLNTVRLSNLTRNTELFLTKISKNRIGWPLWLYLALKIVQILSNTGLEKKDKFIGHV